MRKPVKDLSLRFVGRLEGFSTLSHPDLDIPLASSEVVRLIVSVIEEVVLASVFLLLRPDTFGSTTAGSAIHFCAFFGVPRHCSGTLGTSCSSDGNGDLGDPGVLESVGQELAGTCGVGGVSGLSAVGEAGLDREDLREESNRERLLFIFSDRCGVIACIDGIAVDP